MTPKIVVDIISLVFSLTQVRSLFNKIQTIVLLVPIIWDLVLLEIKQKRTSKCFFRDAMTCKCYTACIGLIQYMIE